MNRYKGLIKPLVIVVIVLLLSLYAIGLAIAAEPKAASSISVKINKKYIKYGDILSISGTLSPVVSGATINIYQRVTGSNDFVLLSNTTVDNQGAFSVNISSESSADIMASWAGDNENDGSQSTAIRVNVKPLVRVKSKGNTASIGKNTRIYGSVSPLHSGKRVWLQYLSGKKWLTLKSKLTDAGSAFSFRIKLNKLQTYKFRVKFYDEDHATGYGEKSVKVRWANPFGISSKYAKYLVVVKAQYKLYLIERGYVTKTFPVVVGKASTRTPSASWKIGEKNPRGGGVQGPLVLRLYRNGHYTRYGLHGTNQEYLLRRWPRGYSHGCIRLYNHDILWLSARVSVGTRVKTM